MSSSADIDIKDKLIDVAMRLFALKGYEATTVREICSASGAYQLSINYHFGGKEMLYKEAILRAFEICDKGNFIKSLGNLPAEKQLFSIISYDLSKVFCNDDRGLFSQMMFWEYPNFSNIMREVIEEVLLPIRAFEMEVFYKISGVKDEFILSYYIFSMISQIISFYQNPVLREKFFGMKDPTEEDLSRIATMICDSLISGIKNVNTKEADNE